MGKVIKEIFPILYFAQFDADLSLANGASDSLEQMLPGNKMDLAVCDVCHDRLLDWVRSIDPVGDSCVPQSIPCISIIAGARDILERLNSNEKDPRKMLDALQALDEKAWLRSLHADVRRRAYGVCLAMAPYSVSLDASFIQSIFGSLKFENESINYADLMAVILAFGRNEEAWSVGIKDPCRDFHLPIIRIAEAVNECRSLSKCFLPLLSVTPRNYWAAGRLAELLVALLRAPRQEHQTVKECMAFIVANAMESLVIDYVSLFSEEEILRRVGPLLNAVSTLGGFEEFQAELLERALALPRDFWVTGNISFAHTIVQNIGSCDRLLYERILERASVSGLDSSLAATIAQVIEGRVLGEEKVDFDRVIGNVLECVGGMSAATIAERIGEKRPLQG